ncbi:SurA N-terminal domain-containing protein [Desulfobacter postgatei]|uniref:Parvulin-like peptidyl-prolyl isomerase n=1 Tax=Desulfobacter postgatei 2ac9 TaxID=879212 RepID=I5B0N5_9BACT|nr:SurA N-terminal domain-containing protein [Desulfobacter postgatei]EIM63048.1 parvulin-like peptidyl-prolyl isomerase [Desulfobacter postgatei 2ac9]
MRKKRDIILMVFILGFFWAASCLAQEVVDRIVAIVNDDIVTLSQLDMAAAPYRKNIETSQESSARQKELMAQMYTQVLNQLVENSLVVQEAKRMGITVDDTDVDNSVENFKKEHNLNQERLELGLAAQGLTLSQYRERIREQILQSMIVSRAVRAKIVVTDEEINAYYQSHYQEFKDKKKYYLKNIIVRDSTDLSTVLVKLENEVDFSQVAKNYSIGSNASSGGELGEFDISSFSDVIKAALEGVGKGQYTKPIDMGDSFQILYVADIISQSQGPVQKEVEKQIQDILYREHGEIQFNKWMENLKNSAHIKIML